MREEKITALKTRYIAYREVYVAYSKHIQRPKLQRTVNQNKINTHKKPAWNKKQKLWKI